MGEESWEKITVLEANGSGTNQVHSSKYTAVTFLPKAFLLQYRRFGNVYFTFIFVIMLLGTYTNLFFSPQKPWGVLAVLVIIFSLNMLTEGLDDLTRKKKDKETNLQPVMRFSVQSCSFEKTTWESLRRGDLLQLSRNEICPADVLLVTTSDVESEALCYVQTANVDGETYLKKRFCNPIIVEHSADAAACSQWLRGRVVLAQPPCSSLSSLETIVKAKDGEDIQDIPLSSDNVILRGSQIRNTQWVWVIVLFTGKDTKALMASGNAPVKQSKVDRLVNRVIVTVLMMLVVLLLISTLVVSFAYTPTSQLWYMRFTDEAQGYIFPDWLTMLLTYLILYRQILPILLYGVQEGLNTIHAKYISWDLNMYDKATDRFATCNTTSLAQEIGQVQWVFSDKTGTLTRNEMRLVACAVDGKVYGRSSLDALEALAQVEASPVQTTQICFERLLAELHHAQSSGTCTAHQAKLIRFLTVLSLCHTVLIESGEELEELPKKAPSELEQLVTPLPHHASKDSTRRLRRSKFSSQMQDGQALSERELRREATAPPPPTPACKIEERELEYNAESPDEEALVRAAAALGFKFAFTEGESTIGIEKKQVIRSLESVDSSEENAPELANMYDEEEVMAKTSNRPVYSLASSDTAQVEGWQVLAVNPFTSDRKRMSVVYRDPSKDGKIMLLCKGADNQVLAVSKTESRELENLEKELKHFSECGLRTLVVAERQITEEEFSAWAAKHQAACAVPGPERKVELDRVASLIEVNLEVLGITAVEDRLQDEVPDTISRLRAAHINFWLITGDKVETAINISRSAGLFTEESILIRLTAESVQNGLAEEALERKQSKDISALQDHLATTMETYMEEHYARMEALPDEDVRGERMGFTGRFIACLESALNSCTSCMQSVKAKTQGNVLPEKIRVEKNLALIVDGETLGQILPSESNEEDTKLKWAFLKLARSCEVVVACRTSPGQKADLVSLIKDNVMPTPVTLAIGDGANDVPMIETGHIGVGISGKEGTHATTAADFAISQFRFLGPLLLVHGRLSYIRIAKSIGIIFYGNLLFTFVSFYYNFVCAFSGQPAFNPLEYIVFQAFIAVPVLAIGALDRDLYDIYDALRFPLCYDVGRLNKLLHLAFVDGQIFRGLAHGALAFVLVFYNDYDASFETLSVSLFIVVTMVLTVRQARISSSFTWPMIGAILFNIIGVFAYLGIVAAVTLSADIFSLSEFGRFFWNQLIATVFLVALLDYMAPVGFYKLRSKAEEFRSNLSKYMPNSIESGQLTAAFSKFVPATFRVGSPRADDEPAKQTNDMDQV